MCCKVSFLGDATQILEGLLPDEETYNKNKNKETDPDVEEEKIQPAPLKDHIERAFVMSIMWSMGALLEIPERAQMETYMKENYSDINYPKQSIGTGESMFDFVVDHNGFWQHWNSKVPQFIYPDTGTPDYTSILVPNIDNVRMDFLLLTVWKLGK
ncbi:hypothetical protein Avbf_11891, partial [Armadillidium vulgare]